MNTYLQKSSAILMGLLMIFGAVLTPQSEVFAQVSETLEEDIVIEEIPINEIHDVQPPEFSPVSNVVREATSSSGTIVSYPLPTALDENQVVSTTCSPESGSQFPLGQTQVICTATDNSNNESQTTFTVSVVDTTAPSFDSIVNIEVVAMQVLTDIPLDEPFISDSVDNFPLITNDAPELFEIGQTIVTWSAEDFSGNISTQTQIISVILPPPEIIGNEEVTFEAISFETPSDLIEIPIEIKSNLVYELENDIPEFFEFGENIVNWTLTDILDNTATLTQKIIFVDTTAPTIDIKLSAITLDKNRDKGTFQIEIDVRDAVDYQPLIIATLNGIPVENGQYVELKQSEKKTKEDTRGMLKIEDSLFTLEVTASDFSENTYSKTISMSLNTYQEIPLEEIEFEELEIEDLYGMLETLKTTPPSDLSNLGLELKELKNIAKILFKQEKSELKEIDLEYKAKLLLETDKTQKKLIKSELKQVKKESREQFKDLQKEYREIFDQYKSVAKSMLKEKKNLEANKLKNEIFSTEISIETLEIQREDDVNQETIKEDNEKQKRTNQIYEKILDRIKFMDDYEFAKSNYEDIHSIKSNLMTVKEKQKVVQEILKTSDKLQKSEFKQIIKDVKKEQKELKKSLKLQEKELKDRQKEIKKLEKEQLKLTKLQNKEIKKLEKELEKIEKEQTKQLEKETQKAEKHSLKQQKELQKKLEKAAKDVQKKLEKDAKKAEKEAKKEAKKAEKDSKK